MFDRQKIPKYVAGCYLAMTSLWAVVFVIILFMSLNHVLNFDEPTCHETCLVDGEVVHGEYCSTPEPSGLQGLLQFALCASGILGIGYAGYQIGKQK